MQKTITQVILAIISALNVAIPLVFNAQSMFPNWPWQYHALAGFIVFVAIIVWMIIDKQSEISKLKNTRPSINVNPIEENNIYYLRVENKGAEGKFKSQINFQSDDPSTLPFYPSGEYYGCWKLGSIVEAVVLKGHTNMIKIAEKVSSSKSTSVSLHFFYFSESSGRECFVSSSSHWIGSYIEHTNGSKEPLEKNKYKLCVTIGSSPELKEGVFQANYVVDIDGIRIDNDS